MAARPLRATINYAAANLAALLDTNLNCKSRLRRHAYRQSRLRHEHLIINVGDGTTSTKTLPYVFLVTDGAQDPQQKGVPNGGWSGSNHATTLDTASKLSLHCTPLKSRGIIVSVLYIPYVTIRPGEHVALPITRTLCQQQHPEYSDRA